VRPSESLARLMLAAGRVAAPWDALTRRRPVIALAGSDAHGHCRRFTPRCLGAVAQTVELQTPWTGDAAADAASLA
jgi:hypothetical protein